jgi:hypothetical protein
VGRDITALTHHSVRVGSMYDCDRQWLSDPSSPATQRAAFVPAIVLRKQLLPLGDSRVQGSQPPHSGFQAELQAASLQGRRSEAALERLLARQAAPVDSASAAHGREMRLTVAWPGGAECLLVWQGWGSPGRLHLPGLCGVTPYNGSLC